MAQLAKIETKQIRISKEHLLKEKELYLNDLDKSEKRKQMFFAILIFLFIGATMLSGSAQLIAMGIVTLAFGGVSIYKSPEVLHVEQQLNEIDQKLELFESHPQKVQSEFERPRSNKATGHRNEDTRPHRKPKNKPQSENKTGNISIKSKTDQKKSSTQDAKSNEGGSRNRGRRRNRNKTAN